MKNIIKKYKKLNNATKENLYELYLFQEFQDLIKEYPDVNIKNLDDVQKVLEFALSCSVFTNLDGGEIIKRILEILEARDISLNDIEELSIYELVELIINSDEEKNIKKISEFFYKGLFCMLSKQNEKYILTYDKEDDDVRVLIFNNIEELLSKVIDNDLLISEEES